MRVPPPLLPFNSIEWIHTREYAMVGSWLEQLAFNSIEWIRIPPRGGGGGGGRQEAPFNSIEWILHYASPRDAGLDNLSIPLNGFCTITLHVHYGNFFHLHCMDSIPLSPRVGAPCI